MENKPKKSKKEQKEMTIEMVNNFTGKQLLDARTVEINSVIAGRSQKWQDVDNLNKRYSWARGVCLAAYTLFLIPTFVKITDLIPEYQHMVDLKLVIVSPNIVESIIGGFATLVGVGLTMAFTKAIDTLTQKDMVDEYYEELYEKTEKVVEPTKTLAEFIAVPKVTKGKKIAAGALIGIVFAALACFGFFKGGAWVVLLLLSFLTILEYIIKHSKTLLSFISGAFFQYTEMQNQELEQLKDIAYVPDEQLRAKAENRYNWLWWASAGLWAVDFGLVGLNCVQAGQGVDFLSNGGLFPIELGDNTYSLHGIIAGGFFVGGLILGLKHLITRFLKKHYYLHDLLKNGLTPKLIQELKGILIQTVKDIAFTRPTAGILAGVVIAALAEGFLTYTYMDYLSSREASLWFKLIPAAFIPSLTLIITIFHSIIGVFKLLIEKMLELPVLETRLHDSELLASVRHTMILNVLAAGKDKNYTESQVLSDSEARSSLNDSYTVKGGNVATLVNDSIESESDTGTDSIGSVPRDDKASGSKPGSSLNLTELIRKHKEEEQKKRDSAIPMPPASSETLSAIAAAHRTDESAAAGQVENANIQPTSDAVDEIVKPLGNGHKKVTVDITKHSG